MSHEFKKGLVCINILVTLPFWNSSSVFLFFIFSFWPSNHNFKKYLDVIEKIVIQHIITNNIYVVMFVLTSK
jgi:hypothetical protein